MIAADPYDRVFTPENLNLLLLGRLLQGGCVKKEAEDDSQVAAPAGSKITALVACNHSKRKAL
jgi:hypothetical protein